MGCPVCGEYVYHDRKVMVVQVWRLVCGVESKLAEEYHGECYDRVRHQDAGVGLTRYMLESKPGVRAAGGVSRPGEDADSQKQRGKKEV